MKVKWRNILIAVGLLLTAIFLVDFNRRMEELDRMNAQLQAVQAEGTAVMQTQVALFTQVAYGSSDDSVEIWAYENKWVRVGEHPIGLVPAGDAAATPAPTAISQAQSVPNWRLWWELFFGSRDQDL
jgi:hypothetical protein